ncbi:MAG: SUF system NifU family Fe-S cluster assembly protein [Mycoplasmataceae bacterium]|jgi:nitrogen fixation NifU-like protein|nr:SUF system NifU family Fe-S cluster assembly protein [Mycoplasmataceae bacterium]
MSLNKNNNIELEKRRQKILQHYESPVNKLKNKNKYLDYSSVNENSPSCIDNLTIYTKIKNNKIVDIVFDGIGCVISTSSTDMMIEQIKNKTINEGMKIIDEYLKMIYKKKYDAKKINDLVVFENVNKQLNRIKCATIGIEAIKKSIVKVKK